MLIRGIKTRGGLTLDFKVIIIFSIVGFSLSIRTGKVSFTRLEEVGGFDSKALLGILGELL
jgi:hypothetical protein